MNTEELNHSYTPKPLQDINRKIAALIADPSAMDTHELKTVIEVRDVFVVSYLDTLESEQKQLFANAELSVNNKLKEVALSFLQSAKDEATHFVRSQAAIKKYK